MNILLDDETVSCAVNCFWEAPAERSTKYANIHLRQPSKKRTRSGQHEKKKKAAGLVRASVWTPFRTSRSGSAGKSFRKVFSSEHVIKSWYGPCRFLAVNNVLDLTLSLEQTYVALAVSSGTGSFAVILLSFLETGLHVGKAILLPYAPEQVVILKGPCILVRSSNRLSLFNVSGDKIPIQSCLELGLTSHIIPQLICKTEHDAEALSAIVEKTKLLSFKVSVFLLSNTGEVSDINKVIEDIDFAPVAMTVSFRNNCLFFVGEDASVIAININTWRILWQSQPSKQLGQPYSMTFYNNMLLLSKQGSSDIYFVSCRTGKTLSISNPSLKSLFSETCEGISSSNHRHFYAPWRTFLLQISNESGSCCADTELDANTKAVQEGKSDEIPSLALLASNLERRVDVGVEQCVEGAERKEEKRRMLYHVRALLMEATGNFPVSKCSIFSEHLENLALLPERRSSISDMLKSGENIESCRLSPSTRVVVPGLSKLNCARFVRLITANYGLDETAQFIALEALVTLQNQADQDENECRSEITLRLHAEVDKCVPMAWEVYSRNVRENGDTVWLAVYAPIGTFANNKALSDVQVTVRVDASDNRSQPLGTFAISSIISNIAHSKDSSQNRNPEQMSLKQQIHVVVQGPGAHHLKEMNKKLVFGRGVDIQTRQNLAYITLSVTSGIELAMIVARLKANVDDNVTLRRTVELSKRSLLDLDTALITLEDEMGLIRNIAARKDGFGYSAEEILQILTYQKSVDDAFGRIEEQLLGL